jgi:hypothetical protein
VTDTVVPTHLKREGDLAAVVAELETAVGQGGGGGGEGSVPVHEAAADPHSAAGYATAAEVTSAIATHTASANAHADFLTEAEADALYSASGHSHASPTTVTDWRTLTLTVPQGTTPFSLPWFVMPTGIDGTVTAITAYRSGGTSLIINVERKRAGVTVDLLASNYTTLTAGHASAGALQNTALQGGDEILLSVESIGGAPDWVTIQLGMTRDAAP